MRDGYADAMIEIAKEDPSLVFVSSDCGSYEREYFKKEGLGRLVETGIAEANAAAVASGLAAEGYTPHLLNFAYLFGRMYNQLSQSVCQDSYNVKLAGYYAGVWGTGGRSHNCITDLSIMRALPNLSIFAPADYWESRAVLKHAHKTGGPTYIRLCGIGSPVVLDSEPEFHPVRPLAEGSSCTIFCHGTMVYESLLANRLGELDASVVDVAQIKPFPAEQILKEARKTGHVVVAEEHSMVGGLAEAIASFLSTTAPMPVRIVAVDDVFPLSVLMEDPDVYDRYKISYRHIIAAARSLSGKQ